MSQATLTRVGGTRRLARAAREGFMVRIAIGFTAWAERWFPDAFVFVAIAVVVVAWRRWPTARRRSRSAARSVTGSGA